MTIRETIGESLPGQASEKIGAAGDLGRGVGSDRPRRIWGTDGRLDSHRHAPVTRGDLAVTTTLTQAIARALLPICTMVGFAVLIKGYTDTGDGFSAGVILALGVVIQMACFGIGVLDRMPILRYAPLGAFAGLLLAFLIAFVPVVAGDSLLTHWPPPGDSVIHLGTLEIITAVAFDISVCLLVFGFIVGTMTLLARTASIAAITQAQSTERHRTPGEAYASRDLRPADRKPTAAERESLQEREDADPPEDGVRRGEVPER